MTFSKKKIINIAIIAGVLLFVVLVIFISVKYAVRSKKGSKKPVVVKFVVVGHSTTGSGTISDTQYNSMNVNDFMNIVLSFVSLPWSIANVVWKVLTINGKTIPIDENGLITISGSQTKLTDLVGSESSITVNGVINHSCAPGDEQPCTDCNNLTPICTATGWGCGKNTKCPDPDELKNCCTDPTKPWATCDSKTFEVSCGQCIESDKPYCADVNGVCQTTKHAKDAKPGCIGCGPKCTPNGWVCSENQTCPDADEAKKCCTDSSKPHASCSNNHIICSACDDSNPPDCPLDCHMSGLVCGSDGKLTCQKNSSLICPTPEQISAWNCCPDPKKPIASCNPNTHTLTCKDCGPKPSRTENHGCPESCEGHDWVCTSKGWVCTPGQTCPQLQSVIDSCCKDGLVGVCDEKSNCITCGCVAGYDQCDAYGCSGAGSNPSKCAKKCCPHGTPCTKNPITGDCNCCEPKQLCTINDQVKCCPNGTTCDTSGTTPGCVAICGIDSTGEPVKCGENQTCIVINNLTSDSKNQLKNRYCPDPTKESCAVHFDDTTDTAYLCMDTNSGCQFSDEYSAPASINNFYTCVPFPERKTVDPDNPGVGYCIPKTIKYQPAVPVSGNAPSTFSCDFGDAVAGECDKYETTADCNADAKCTWRNVLEYVANSDPRNGDMNNQLGQINCDIAFLQDNYNGNFCDPSNGTTSYQRVVAFQGDKSDCTWQNCWAQVSQPGVNDVYYNSDTGVCAALHSCNAPASDGLNASSINNSDGNREPVNSSVLKLSEFSSCDTNPPCPGGLEYQCDYNTGQLQNQAWYPHHHLDKGKLVCVKDIMQNRPGHVAQLSEADCLNYWCDKYPESCCANGYIWDPKTNKCFQSTDISIDGNCSTSGGGFQCHTSSHGNKCGDTWNSHCTQSISTPCHGYCCTGSPSHPPQGGGMPDDVPRSYCVLKKDSKGNFEWVNYEKAVNMCLGDSIGDMKKAYKEGKIKDNCY